MSQSKEYGMKTYDSGISNVGTIKESQQVDHGNQGNDETIQLEVDLAVQDSQLFFIEVIMGICA